MLLPIRVRTIRDLRLSNSTLFPRTVDLRVSLIICAALLALVCSCRAPTDATKSNPKLMTNTSETAAVDALEIHRRAIIVDMHADTAQRLVDEHLDLEKRLPDGHLDAVRARQGGLDGQFFSIWVEPELFGGGGARAMKRADVQIEAVRALAENHPETWELAVTAADIKHAAANRKIAALMGLEGGYAINEKIENVDRYYQMGVRYMSPAWSVSLSWAGSSGDAAGKTRGLNDFGKEVVREMNRRLFIKGLFAANLFPDTSQ